MSASSRPGKGKGKESASILDHMMEQLVAGGFISKPFEMASLDSREATELERCLTNMIARLNSSQQDLARLMDKHRSLASDFDRLDQMQSRSRQTLEASEYEKEQAKAKASAATRELSTEQAKHNQAKDEIQKARLALASVKTLAQHDSKRREMEVASILSRWQKVSSSSTSVQHAAIIVNSQEKIGKNESLARSRDNGRETPSGMTLLEESLRQADEQKSTLQEENIHLREVMGDVMTEVRATLSSINVEVPALQQELDDPFVQVTSPHLVLSPNEMLDYLSKLLVTLRDATQNALQASDEAVSAAIAKTNKEASAKVAELESSLAAMQSELDAARTSASSLSAEVLEKEKEKGVYQTEMIEKMDVQKRDIKRYKLEVQEARKQVATLQTSYDAERIEVQALRTELAKLQAAADVPLDHEKTTKRKRETAVAERDDSIESVAEPPAKRSSRPVRQSTTSAALKHILASSADTPPGRVVPLSSKATNVQSASRGTATKKDDITKAATKSEMLAENETVEVPAPSTAALAAKERIHRAVEAAKRSGTSSRAASVTQRRK